MTNTRILRILNNKTKSLILGLLLLGSIGLAYAEVKTAIFAGGCFWCMEPPFDAQTGVLQTISGYTGGNTVKPTYQQVSAGTTGHYEAIQIIYDSDKVSFATLLEIFWRNVDPLDATGQFCDKGSQYRSAIFYQDAAEKAAAENSKQTLAAKFDKPIVTQILPAQTFYPAEEYHQDYYQKNAIRYKFYRNGCGRDARLKQLWDTEK